MMTVVLSDRSPGELSTGVKVLLDSQCNKLRQALSSFYTINSVPNFPQSFSLEPSLAVCERFLNFFVDKVASAQALISCPSYDPSTPAAGDDHFDHLEPISLSFLTMVIDHLKRRGSPTDTIPPRLFKEVRSTIAPSLLPIINSRLDSGSVTGAFKSAVVQPIINKLEVIQSGFKSLHITG